jgi:hypothetical protein
LRFRDWRIPVKLLAVMLAMSLVPLSVAGLIDSSASARALDEQARAISRGWHTAPRCASSN